MIGIRIQRSSAIVAASLLTLAYGSASAQTSPRASTAIVQAIDERRFTGQESGENAGKSVSSAGDINGDGFVDFIVGAPNSDGGGSDRGRAYLFFGSPSPLNTLVSNADVILIGEADNDAFGESVSAAGDVDGDGYADVIVGASENDAGGSGAGRAYVFLGGAVMDATADLVLTGAAANDEFGASVSDAGDVNGDGYGDVIVGAFNNAALGAGTGRAYVFFGGASLDATADVTLTGGAAGHSFGTSVSSAGDVNADGYDDIVVGAIGAAASSRGEAYVYLGNSSMDNIADVTLSGDAMGVDFGNAVASAGDVNGDGFGDVIVGDYYYPLAGDDAGRAYVFFGDMSMDGSADVTFLATAVNDFLGESVASAGDINGDGFADVVVGAPESDLVVPAGGTALVFFGGLVMDNVADVVLGPEVGSGGFGRSVAPAGDINGDGYEDLLIGSDANDAISPNAGRAYLYMNRMTGTDRADAVLPGTVAGGEVGYSVSFAGDFNGDGFDDMIVGAPDTGTDPGMAYIYYGGQPLTGAADVVITGEAAPDNFGASVAALGDHNGDGFDDVIVGGFGDGGVVSGGQAYVFLGSATPSSSIAAAQADVKYTVNVSTFHYAYRVIGADVNGDGFTDAIVVGDHTSMGPGFELSAAVFYGSGTLVDKHVSAADFLLDADLDASVGDVNGDGFADIAAKGSDPTEFFGLHLGGVSPDTYPEMTIAEPAGYDFYVGGVAMGDLNGDGYDDMAFSAVVDPGGADDGHVFIFHGGLTFPATEEVGGADLVLDGLLPGDGFGRSLASCDLNADGYDDLVVGASAPAPDPLNDGKTFVYFGGATMDAVADVVLAGATDEFGSAVACNGDLNGDGLADILVGEPVGVGTVYLYLTSSPAVVPRITSIADVPEDQGGQVALRFTRSGYDYAGIDRIASYTVERSAPPGGSGFAWDAVATISPSNESLYGPTVSTPSDQTSNSTHTYFFRVLAHGVDGELWKSAHVSGSSIDNLSPIPPQSASVAYVPGGALVEWDENLTDGDLLEYNVYRSLTQGFTPTPGDLQAETTASEYFDDTVNNALTYYYVVTAEDIHTNESDPSNEAVLDPALSIALEGFDAFSDDRSVVFSWTLTDPDNFVAVDIEYSTPANVVEIETPDVIEANRGSFTARVDVRDYGHYSFRLRMQGTTGVISYSPSVELDVTLDESYKIEPPYPNPTGSDATIELTVREEQDVLVSLYDVVGRSIGVAFSDRMQANQTARIEISSVDLAPGVYLIRTTGDAFVDVRTLVVQ